MGNLVTKSQNLSTQADYSGEGLTINVNYNEDAISSTLKSLNGQIYKASDSTYAGQFNGSRQGEDIEYSMNNVKTKDMPAVFTALADIEQLIAESHEPQPNAE